MGITFIALGQPPRHVTKATSSNDRWLSPSTISDNFSLKQTKNLITIWLFGKFLFGCLVSIHLVICPGYIHPLTEFHSNKRGDIQIFYREFLPGAAKGRVRGKSKRCQEPVNWQECSFVNKKTANKVLQLS